jgi:gamma-glutamylcyclotransferase (GGCT)/AIG2-like uncharacterized protein YtfP
MSTWWWQAEGLADRLQVALDQSNEARRRPNGWELDACKDYLGALNQLWTTLFTVPRCDESSLPPSEKSTAGKRFTELLKTLPPTERAALLAMRSVEEFATFEPSILSHEVAGVSQRLADIPLVVRERASAGHDEFKRGWGRWRQTDAGSTDVLRRLSRAVLVVRDNFSHGEKTRSGPDEERNKRNRAVSKVLKPVLEGILDFVLDQPSQRLIAYGTLRPGRPNHSVLDVEGTWLPVTLNGLISEKDGLPVLTFTQGAIAEAELCESSELPFRWQRLDQFEGIGYERQLGLYRHNGTVGVANVYVRSV